MNDLLVDLIVGFLDSTMSFADFVNHLNWNKTLDKASVEKTVINLSHTNRTWSYYAQLVLRRRVVVFDGAFGLRQYFRQGESASERPWVREIYFAMKNRQGRRSQEHAARLLMRLFQTCPNVEELFIYTCFQSRAAPFVPVIRLLGNLHHLKALWLQHNLPYYTYRFAPNLSDFLVVLPKLERLERLFVDRWNPFDFNEVVEARGRYGSSLKGGSGDDLNFSPPGSLKTMSLTFFIRIQILRLRSDCVLVVPDQFIFITRRQYADKSRPSEVYEPFLRGLCELGSGGCMCDDYVVKLYVSSFQLKLVILRGAAMTLCSSDETTSRGCCCSTKQ